MNKPLPGLLISGATLLALLAAGCGTVPTIGGRTTPPDFDGINYPRAMVLVQNVGIGNAGEAQFLDVLHNTASNRENNVHQYVVSGYSAANPLTIQDFPGRQIAFLYSLTGTFTLVNTATDSVGTSTSGLLGVSSSIYESPDLAYTYAAVPNFNGGIVEIIRASDGYVKKIPLPNIAKLAMSPGGTTLLAFQLNSDNVWQVNNLNGDIPNATVTQLTGTFDRPINAVFSADGAYFYVMNCGPQCGGTTASVSIFSTTQQNGVYPQLANIPVPGGVHFALQNGTNLYVAGMTPTSDGSFTGTLTQISTATNSIVNTLAIGDGNHFRMSIGDDNTLWIGATNCTTFERGIQGTGTGCLTMVKLDASGNLSSAMIEGSHGDIGGIAPIQQTGTEYTFGHELYSTEGGQVYIYSTVDGSAIDASLVQVVGYASDIAFVDGIYNTQP